MSAEKTLIVVAGPTAVGKTALTVKLAKYFDTEILSADSRQFYREMNLGTAKPPGEEMEGITHHFINSLSIKDDYNAGDFEKDALERIRLIMMEKPVVLLTGGSGLYIKAVCEGLDNMPLIPGPVREALNSRYRQYGLAPLLAELEERDPLYFATVDRQNPQRVIRALEVCISTGRPYTQIRNTAGRKVSRPFTIIKIGLERNREELYERIDRRMDIMIAQGLFQEAEALYPYREKNALQTVGYKEIFDYLEGRYDRSEAVRLLKRNSRRYAKRQMTWFKRQEQMTWFHPESWDKIIAYLKSGLSV